MKSIFIIDSTEKLDDARLIELVNKSEISKFLFIKKNEAVRSLLSAFSNSSEIDVSNDYLKHAKISRDNIVKFFADFPRRTFHVGGRKRTSFHSLFGGKGFSSWWLMNFADKAPEAGGIVNRLFQLDMVKAILEKGGFDLGLIYSSDDCFASSLHSLFALLKISSYSNFTAKLAGFEKSRLFHNCIGKDNAGDKGRFLSTGVFLIMKNAFRLIVSKFIASAAVKLTGSAKENEVSPPNFSFHSWYPANWYNYGENYYDRYFFGLIEFVNASSSTVRPSYLFKLKWYEKNFVKLFGSLKKLSFLGCSYDFLDRYVEIAYLARAYYSAFEMSRKLNSAFLGDYGKEENKIIFKYYGIDIFNLAYAGLIESLLIDMPYNLILSRALARYLKCNENIKSFVNFLELYAYARGFINEVRRDAELAKIKMIAFQHSTITTFNLHYNYDETETDLILKNDVSRLPVPDLFILSGKKARETLSSFITNREKLFVTGAPRYDFMLKYLHAVVKGGPRAKARSVLIASVGNYEESVDIVELCLEALCGRKGVSVVIKMHPICDISVAVEKLFDSCEKYRSLKYEIKKDNVYDLIVASDVLITSNSMVGLEALVLGSNVVLYGDPYKINLSPLADSLEFSDRICYSNDKFKDAIGKAIDGEFEKPSPEAVNKLIEDNYYKLDGLANERILKILEDAIDE